MIVEFLCSMPFYRRRNVELTKDREFKNVKYMNRNFLTTGALFCLLAVILGAFGAHALKSVLEPERLLSFETSVRYQFYHGLALLICGMLWRDFPSVYLQNAGRLFMLGVVLFSGSIYLLACRTPLGLEGWNWLGPITPLGGILLIAGWILMLLAFWKKRDS